MSSYHWLSNVHANSASTTAGYIIFSLMARFGQLKALESYECDRSYIDKGDDACTLMQGSTDRGLLRLNTQNPFLPLVKRKRENRRRQKCEADDQGVGVTKINPETRCEESVVVSSR
jgi:hypothetical protein